MGMDHVEMVGQRGAVADEVADGLRRLTDILWGGFGVSRVIQRTVFEQVILEIGWVKLADEGAVHVEGGDAVLLRNEVGRGGGGHVLHISLQRCQRLAGVPQGEILLLCESFLLAARSQYSPLHEGAQEDDDQKFVFLHHRCFYCDDSTIVI